MSARTSFRQAPLRGRRDHPGRGGKAMEDAHRLFKIGPGRWEQQPCDSIYAAVVADGVTSKPGGKTASVIAVDTVQYVLRQELQPQAPPKVVLEAMVRAIRRANQEILRHAQHHPDLGNMSTTLVLALIAGGRLFLAHLGDSRAYLIRRAESHRLTLDHTWVQQALDHNLRALEEIKENPNRNVIRRYLGIRTDIEIDPNIVMPGTYDLGPSGRQFATWLDLEPGDIILLCTDGLTDQLTDETLCEQLQRYKHSPQKAANQLVRKALALNEQDNITVVLLSLVDASPGAVLMQRTAPLLAMMIALVLLMAGVTLFRAPVRELAYLVAGDRGAEAIMPLAAATLDDALLVVAAVQPTAGAELASPIGLTQTTVFEAANSLATGVVLLTATTTLSPIPTDTSPLTPTPYTPARIESALLAAGSQRAMAGVIPSATATDTPTSSSTSSPTATSRPTFTQAPTFTPTPPPSPTPPRQTPSPRLAVDQTEQLLLSGIEAGETIQSTACEVTLEWNRSHVYAAPQGVEIRAWSINAQVESGRGLTDARTPQSPVVANFCELDAVGAGEYFVALVGGRLDSQGHFTDLAVISNRIQINYQLDSGKQNSGTNHTTETTTGPGREKVE